MAWCALLIQRLFLMSEKLGRCAGAFVGLMSCQGIAELVCFLLTAAMDLAALMVAGGAGDWLQAAALVQALNAWLRANTYIQRLLSGEVESTGKL